MLDNHYEVLIHKNEAFVGTGHNSEIVTDDAGNDWIFYHEYNEKYHLGDWRCWYDFGMGALGDWGAHILDTVHEFLELGLPYEVSMLYEKGHNDYFYPYSSTILFRFPQRKGMPPVDITWYDGLDNLPPIPAGYGVSGLDPNIPKTNQGDGPAAQLNPGKIIYSKDLIFKGGTHDYRLETK